MDPIEVDVIETPELDDPVFIEGLPGVGLVGKLAADHLVGELESEPVRHVYSEHFPPAVSIDETGTASLPVLTVHAVRTDGRDLLVLAGEAQAQDPPGQYRLAEATLDIAATFGVEEIITIGGYGTGEEVDEYRVLGAAAERSDELKNRLEQAGAEFERDDHPGNIVGMSGLLVGLGGRRDLQAAGMLGLTPGYHVDPTSARAVLDVLQAAFDFTVDLETLVEQAERVQQLIQQIQRLQHQQEQPPSPSAEDLRYFG